MKFFSMVVAALLSLRVAGAEGPSLKYRGVFDPDGFSPEGDRTTGDVWRLTLLEAREVVSETASIIGYEWLTPAGAKPWNTVRTYAGLRAPANPLAPRLQRPGDFYYFFPIFDREPGAAPAAPASTPGSDPYRQDQGVNRVDITREPVPAPAEKVFVRYTLETLSPAPSQP